MATAVVSRTGVTAGRTTSVGLGTRKVAIVTITPSTSYVNTGGNHGDLLGLKAVIGFTPQFAIAQEVMDQSATATTMLRWSYNAATDRLLAFVDHTAQTTGADEQTNATDLSSHRVQLLVIGE